MRWQGHPEREVLATLVRLSIAIHLRHKTFHREVLDPGSGRLDQGTETAPARYPRGFAEKPDQTEQRIQVFLKQLELRNGHRRPFRSPCRSGFTGVVNFTRGWPEILPRWRNAGAFIGVRP